MKPQQPNIDWCKKNRELVMRWLERRGGWQEGDWYTTEGYPGSGEQFLGLIHNANWRAYPDALWLLTKGDALEMLERVGIESIDPWRHTSGWVANGHFGTTILIALMELLKSAEGENA